MPRRRWMTSSSGRRSITAAREQPTIHVLPSLVPEHLELVGWRGETAVEGSGDGVDHSLGIRRSARFSSVSSTRSSPAVLRQRDRISLDCSVAALRKAISRMPSTNMSVTTGPKR